MPDARVGQFYTARMRGSGGTKPYGWEMENSPAWLQLDPSSGILSGVPTETAIHDIMIRVGDSEGNSESKLMRLSVYPHEGLSITTRILPAAVYEQGYSVGLEAIGGITPYFFTLRQGTSLPPGLTLDSTGKLSGTPANSGAYDFTVDVLDGNGLQGSALYTMAILDENSQFDFLVREYESEKWLRLSFYLPKAFDETRILSVEASINPDVYVWGGNSSVTREQNGAHKAVLTLYVTEEALTGAESWSNVLDELTLDEIFVIFENASGEAIWFDLPLAIKDMKREESQGGGSDDEGGCNSLGLGLPVFLILSLILRSRKT